MAERLFGSLAPEEMDMAPRRRMELPDPGFSLYGRTPAFTGYGANSTAEMRAAPIAPSERYNRDVMESMISAGVSPKVAEKVGPIFGSLAQGLSPVGALTAVDDAAYHADRGEYGSMAAAAMGVVPGGRGLRKLAMDEGSRLARAIEQGFGPERWYHGGQRMDRLTETGAIIPKRATSGPMPFFSSDPEMASAYAMGKKGDTSLVDNGMIQEYFTVAPKSLGWSGRREIPVEQSWNWLPPEVRADISDRARRVGHANIAESDGPMMLHPPGVNATSAGDHYDWVLKNEARGNPLHALRELWHDSGRLVGNETELANIFRLAGYPHPISEKNAPWTEARGVLPAYLRMRNPLVTSDEATMQRILPEMEQAFKRDRTRLQPYGVDLWDKNHQYTPRDWVAQAKEDYIKGDNSFSWTSIPDKITDQFRRMGFDSIIDSGGKMGGATHRVAIPFDPSQVRSIFARFDPDKVGSKLLLGGAGVGTFGSLAPWGGE